MVNTNNDPSPSANSRDFELLQELEARIYGMNRHQINCKVAQRLVTNANQNDAVTIAFKAVLLHPKLLQDSALRKSKDEALSAWEKAKELGLSAEVDSGNVWASWLTGMWELAGETQVAVDAARQYFNVSAEKGHAASQHYLGRCYLHDGNIYMARDYFELAAARGNAESQFYLGLLYEYGGRNVPQEHVVLP